MPKWWGNYSKQTIEQEQERILKTLYAWKNHLQHNMTILNHRIQDMVEGVILSKPAGGKDPPKKDPTTSKPRYIQRANINESPRPGSTGDQGHCTTECHRSSIIEVHTINPGSQNRSQEESHKQWEDKETIPK